MTRTRLALAMMAAALVPIGAAAQSTSIQFQNTSTTAGPVQVPILNNSQIQFDENGNLVASCELETGTTVCKGMTTGPSTAAPTLSLSASPLTIKAGETSRLTWTTGNTPQICLPSIPGGSPALSAWTGTSTDVKLKSVGGSNQDLTFTTPGNYNLALRCWNEGGASPLRTASITVEESDVVIDPGCTIDPNLADPWYTPAGYTERVVSWSSAFNNTQFFTPTTYLHPIGSRTINDQSVSNNYIVIPFTPVAGQNYKLDWAEAQAVALVGYFAARPAHAVYVTIRKCRGDFRKENNQSSDDSLKRGCRRAGQKNNINFNTTLAASSTSTCAIEAGKQYYVNILFADPTSESPSISCETGTKCEANFQPNLN